MYNVASGYALKISESAYFCVVFPDWDFDEKTFQKEIKWKSPKKLVISSLLTAGFVMKDRRNESGGNRTF